MRDNDNFIARLYVNQFRDHMWQGIQAGLSFSEARNKAEQVLGALPVSWLRDEMQRDHDEYIDEMSLGGRTYRR